MRISSGLSGALQENMYDGITVLGTISEGRFFRVLKARMGTKHIILKSAGHKDAMTTEFLRREFELGITPYQTSFYGKFEKCIFYVLILFETCIFVHVKCIEKCRDMLYRE